MALQLGGVAVQPLAGPVGLLTDPLEALLEPGAPSFEDPQPDLVLGPAKKANRTSKLSSSQADASVRATSSAKCSLPVAVSA